jgi:hypothetical protein
MISELVEEELRSRAAKRVEWAVRALNASANDLDAVGGARDVAELLWAEAERLERLAEQVRTLVKVA